MRWASPQWFWALAGLPIFYLLAVYFETRRQKLFRSFAHQNVWQLIAPEADWRSGIRKMTIWLAGMVFIILALARPQYGAHEEVVKTSGLDVVFVLDVSNSMEVEDIVPSRLKKAKHFIRSLADRLWGDRVGLVAFAGSAYFACPLTTDTEYFLEQVSAMEPRMIANQGTDIAVGLNVAREAMERGAEESRVLKSSRVIVLVSDGENHEDGDLEAAKKLPQSGIQFYVLGIGTQKGGPVPVRDETGTLRGYKRGRGNEPVISSFRPESLTAVAKAGGGQYWDITQNEREVDDILASIGALSRSEREEKRVVTYEERFQYPLFIGVVLLLFELGMASRKRVTIGIAILMMAWSALSSDSARAELLKNQPSVETYLENQKGIDALKQGNVDEAKRHFGTAQALDPTRPELSYNQGLIQMKEGDIDGAIQSFSASVRDPKISPSALLNMGAALAKKGDRAGAIRSYLEAIEQAKDRKDASVEEKSRKNLELLMKQSPPSPQPQSSPSSGQSQDQNQNQNQKQDQKQDPNQKQNQGQSGNPQQDSKGQSKDQEKNQPNQKKDDKDQKDKDQSNESKPSNKDSDSNNDPKQKQKPGKQPFRSQKLSDEDADRVMSELSNRDRELQTRLRKRNAKPTNNPKDW